MNDSLLLEFMNRVKELELRVETLEKEVKRKNIMTKTNRFQALFDYLNDNLKEGKEHFTVSMDKIKELVGLEYLTYDEMEKIPDYRIVKGGVKFFEYGAYPDQNGVWQVEYALRPRKGIIEITDFIKRKIATSNGEYIDINAYDIHKEMKLLSRVPTVCAAMKKLKTDIDIIIGGEEDIPSSKFTIRYYKRNKE